MTRRVVTKLERPFAYNHFEKISLMTTKTGLIEQLGAFYQRNS